MEGHEEGAEKEEGLTPASCIGPPLSGAYNVPEFFYPGTIAQADVPSASRESIARTLVCLKL